MYGWFRGWLEKGSFDRLLCDTARPRRQAAGRRAEPGPGTIDTQLVECIPVRGPRGYDAAKSGEAPLRPWCSGASAWPQATSSACAEVDADGTWLAVVPASVRERDTLPALEAGEAGWPSLHEAILGGGFTAARCQEWSNLHGMRHRVVECDPDQKGFVVLERRWVVERGFGWLARRGGLLRDRAGRLDVSAARLAFAAVLTGVPQLRAAREDAGGPSQPPAGRLGPDLGRD